MLVGGWAMVPWIILSTALTFLNFMAAYAVFMAPIAGIMFTDYWLVKKKHYDVPALYDPRGRYHTWVSIRVLRHCFYANNSLELEGASCHAGCCCSATSRAGQQSHSR